MFKTKIAGFFAGVLALTASAAFAYGPVQPSGSDAQAVNYNAFQASTITPFINANTFGTTYSPPFESPSPLTLSQTSSVRVYFVSSDADFNNLLGLSTNGDFTQSAAKNIFTKSQVSQGSFVDIGTLAGGTTLEFYLNPDNGAYGGLWWNTKAENVTPPAYAAGSDEVLDHVKLATFTNDGKTYLLLAWEDRALQDPINDFDFNDFFVVAEIVPQVGVPEPATYLMLGSLLAVGMLAYRKKMATI
jgi:hypothetical protein